MNKFTAGPSILAFSMFVIGWVLCAWYGINFGFGAQCDEAGYTGAAKEACVIRRTNGGPVYVENASGTEI